MTGGERRFDAALTAALAALVAGVAIVDPGRYVDFHKAYDAVAREILRSGTFAYSYPSLKNLPIVAALFLPLAAMPRDAADVVFVAVQLAAYVAAFALALAQLARTRAQKWGLLALFACCRPFYVSIQLGQLTVPCFTLLVATLVALRANRPRTAGALASLAFALKIPAGLLVAWFALRGWRSAAASAVATTAAVVAVSLVAFGPALHRDYWDMVIVSNAGRTLTAGNNASVAASAMRLARARQPAQGDDLRRWRMIRVPPAASALLAAASLALLLALGAALRRRNAAGDEALALEFSLVTCAALVVPPIVWDHYFVFLLVPLFVTGRRALAAPRGPAVGVWLAAFALANFPVAWAIDSLAPHGDYRLLRSAIPSAPLLASLALLGLAARQHRALAARVSAGPDAQAAGVDDPRCR